MATQQTKAVQHKPILNVYFYRTEAGNEPVREWLKSLEQEERKQIGTDIKTAQFGWLAAHSQAGKKSLGSALKFA